MNKRHEAIDKELHIINVQTLQVPPLTAVAVTAEYRGLKYTKAAATCWAGVREEPWDAPHGVDIATGKAMSMIRKEIDKDYDGFISWEDEVRGEIIKVLKELGIGGGSETTKDKASGSNRSAVSK